MTWSQKQPDHRTVGWETCMLAVGICRAIARLLLSKLSSSAMRAPWTPDSIRLLANSFSPIDCTHWITRSLDHTRTSTQDNTQTTLWTHTHTHIWGIQTTTHTHTQTHWITCLLDHTSTSIHDRTHTDNHTHTQTHTHTPTESLAHWITSSRLGPHTQRPCNDHTHSWDTQMTTNSHRHTHTYGITYSSDTPTNLQDDHTHSFDTQAHVTGMHK